jgi:hypothetical protein
LPRQRSANTVGETFDEAAENRSNQSITKQGSEMGFMMNPKKTTTRSDAQAAWYESAPVFSAVVNYPTTKTGDNAGIVEWTAEISAVVAIGWKLHSWSVAPDRRGNLVAFPLFS